jgi:hypothetical protein
MKLAILMYLEEDDRCVERLLKESRIEAYSRLPVEGRVPGTEAGWYGEIAPYQSRLIMAVVPDDTADVLMRAVAECTGVQDPRHPIRAVSLDVESFTCCDVANPEERGEAK